MDGSSLFPNQSILEGALGAPAPLVQFKAGMMSHDTTTNLVTADPRKGMLQIITSPEDNMPHLQWRTRPGREVEQDLIVIPGEAEMKRVESTSARVYVLKWLGTTTKMFFWMQGGDDTEDEQHIANVNRILGFGPPQDDVQQPPVPPPSLRIPEQVTDADIEEARGALPMPTAPAAAAESGDTEMTPAPAGAPPTTQAAAGSALTLDAFSRMLDAMPSVQNQNPAALAAARRAVLTEPTVPDLLRSSELGDALQTPNVQRALPALFEHLPEADRNAEAVAELMRCPQLLTQAASLSRALSSGQGAGLLRSLGLDEADGDSIGMNALLEALKKAQEKK